MKTVTLWKQDMAFESSFDGHTVELNGASGPDGKRLGFSPKALLLSGLAGCSGIDVVEMLNKMRVPFTNLEITVQSEQTEEHPKVFKDIYIEYRLTAEATYEDKIKRAVDLSLEKYCGVAAMLRKNSTIIPSVVLLP
ncbi:MAG TPA: OsmC family protein [Phnomibacter sp.]|nr:OsmC family protein [Phnomibacter sp.]